MAEADVGTNNREAVRSTIMADTARSASGFIFWSDNAPADRILLSRCWLMRARVVFARVDSDRVTDYFPSGL